MKKNKMVITFIANIAAFAVNIVINFFLTPYIVNNIGSESYGFISMANNFTNYIQLLTVALNSMAGRFITIEIHRKNIKKANQYFNSVLIANVVMVVIMIVPVTLLILHLNNLINISPNLVNDVKVLFALTFIGFFVSIIGAAFSSSTFIADRLDLSAGVSMGAYLIRLVVLVLLFMVFKPSVYFVGVAGVITAIYTIIMNIHYTNRLIPDIKVDKKYFDKKNLLEIIASGIWNTITKVGVMLADGLDLLITNLFINTSLMGTLAVAKTVPGVLTGLVGTISSIFTPTFTINYAVENKKELINNITVAITVTSLISNVVYTALLVCGKQFFSLWVPIENAELLQILSILTIGCNIINGGVNCLQQLYTVLNKVRIYSIVFVSTSLLSVCTVFILLKTTSLGIFAVAGVSTCVAILRNLLFVIPYIAVQLQERWTRFYPVIFRNLLVVLISVIIELWIKKYINIDSWMMLIVYGLISCAITVVVNFIIAINPKDWKKYLFILLRR